MLIYVNGDGHLKRSDCHFEFISSFYLQKCSKHIKNHRQRLGLYHPILTFKEQFEIHKKGLIQTYEKLR